MRAGDMLVVEFEKLLYILHSPAYGESIEMDLWVWIRHVNAIAATNGIYGSRSPLENPDVEAAFETGYKNHGRQIGVFWTVWDFFSRPQLLSDIRDELERVAVIRYDGEKNGPIFELDIGALKTRCPLLLSAHEETQRTRMIHANIRQVMEDTMLDERYWLKKGSFLQIPNKTIHTPPEVWGNNAMEYDPRRFMEKGGAMLGRQFASTQILIFAAMMVLRVDMEPVGVSGQWNSPGDMTGAIAVINPPAGKVDVQIRSRKAAEGVWKFKTGESKTGVPLTSG
ncbi:hypothetical protein H072_4430 [Dactylellina haptotyla CBS 200.50]|uniref:Uncharacterized protein n=1 Tax=Dactylellina haptotyla (strain CBS 200.50) TaxID=1284197 RepID=S8AF39_DACHA|nr:hypothetical protein H072_4430 [Dactylellina haptotyla CBS 200.50]